MQHQQLLQQINTTTQTKIIATGGGTPCFYNAIDLMNKVGITIWLNQDIAVIKNNIQHQSSSRPLLANTSSTEFEKKLMTLFEERKQIYAKSLYCLNGNEITIENLEKIIVEYV